MAPGSSWEAMGRGQRQGWGPGWCFGASPCQDCHPSAMRGAVGWGCQLQGSSPVSVLPSRGESGPGVPAPVCPCLKGCPHALTIQGLPCCPPHQGFPPPQEHPPSSNEMTQTVLGIHHVGLQKGIPLASLGFRPGPLGLQPCCTWDQAHTQPGGTAKPLLSILFVLKWALSLERHRQILLHCSHRSLV